MGFRLRDSLGVGVGVSFGAQVLEWAMVPVLEWACDPMLVPAPVQGLE